MAKQAAIEQDGVISECVATVAMITVKFYDTIESYNVALLKNICRRETVNYRLVHLDTQRSGKTLITQATVSCGRCAVTA